MSSDQPLDDTIDLTGGGSPGAPVNGNGQVARNGSTRGNVGGDGHGRADGRANGDGTRSAPDADVLLVPDSVVLSKRAHDIIEWGPTALVVDEVQRFKSPRAGRTRALHQRPAA